MVQARRLIDEDKSIVLDDGYALLKESDGVVRVAELVALSDQTLNLLIEKVESRATKAVINRFVLDDNLYAAYQSQGYQVQRESFAMIMGISEGDESINDVFGEDFFLTSLDTF